MRRIRENQASEEVRVLNVPEIEGNDAEFGSINWDLPLPLSNAGGELGNLEGEGDWEECDEIYQELLNGVRRV